MGRRTRALIVATTPTGLIGPSLVAYQATAGLLSAARSAEPVVLTGAELPTWSRLAAGGTPATYPSGTGGKGVGSGKGQGGGRP